jgi:hypothetical protein
VAMKTLRPRNQTLAQVLKRIKTPPAKPIPTEVVPLAALPTHIIQRSMRDPEKHEGAASQRR